MAVTSLTGTPSRDYTPAYGGVPFAADPLASAAQAIGGNITNLESLSGLASAVNQFQNAQVLGNLEANLPGFSARQAKSMQNIADWQAGRVGGDVLYNLSQEAAELGAGTGRPLGQTPSTNAAFLRALGVTSLGLQQQAEQALTGAVGRTPTADIFDITRGFVTPEEMQAANQAANIYSSLPNPKAAADAALAAARAGAGGTSTGPMTVTTTRIPGAAGGGSGAWYRAPGLEGLGGW